MQSTEDTTAEFDEALASCNPADYTTYHGTEVPKKSLPIMTDTTKKVLRTINKHGACKIEVDDSFEGYNTIHQLEEISGAVGYDFIPNDEGRGYVYYLLTEDIPSVSN